MENIEIDYSENIVCPYCNAILVHKDVEEDYSICEHTIFIATDHGFEYISDDMKSVISEENRVGSYDDYTSQLSINGIRIADYVPAPSFFGVYWGFQPNDKDDLNVLEKRIDEVLFYIWDPIGVNLNADCRDEYSPYVQIVLNETINGSVESLTKLLNDIESQKIGVKINEKKNFKIAQIIFDYKLV